MKKVKIFFKKSLKFILFAMNKFSHSTYLSTPSGNPKSKILAKFVHSKHFFLALLNYIGDVRLKKAVKKDV